MAIFEKFGKTGNTGGQAPYGQAQPAFADRLEQSKAEASGRVLNLLQELGKVFYESHVDDHQTEYETQLTAIRNAYTEIEQYEQQFEEIAAHRRCPACGAQLAEGSMFCNFCGTKLPEIQPVTNSEGAQEQKLCPQCKAPVSPDDMFCTSCGADLRNNAAKEG